MPRDVGALISVACHMNVRCTGAYSSFSLGAPAGKLNPGGEGEQELGV